MENLMSHILTLIGTVIAPIVIAWVIYHLSKDKRLEYENISDVRLASFHPDHVKDLELIYKGQIVTGPRVVTIRIVNSGRLPIKPDDFVQPIKFTTFRGGRSIFKARILLCEPQRSNPANMPIEIVTGINYFQVMPMLLNPKDEFIIKLVVDGGGDFIPSEGRIEGVKNISHVLPRTPRRLIFGFWITGISLTLLLLFIFFNHYLPETVSDYVGMFLLISLGIGVSPIFSSYPVPKRSFQSDQLPPFDN